MNFIPFQLEQWQSEYEQEVAFNLADSGVQPVTLQELVDDSTVRQRLLNLPIHYPPVNGTPALRQTIADLYSTDPANVLVTVGGSEANAIAVHSLLGPGDHIVVMEPGYRQVWGMAHNLGCKVTPYRLRAEKENWRFDFDELEASVTPDTRLIAVTNPNNPTGKILTPAEMEKIVGIAARNGAWILADEVYRGSERLTDAETSSFFGRYDRVIAVNSMSKSYGLSGLRIGWIAAPSRTVQDIWRRHEYAVISAGAVDMLLAEIALGEQHRSQLLQRTRRFIREGYARLEHWVRENSSVVSIVPPESTALAFVGYQLDAPSVAVAHAIRQAGVLVAPGAYFGAEGHLRITHGLNSDYLQKALAIVASVLQQLQRGQASATEQQAGSAAV